MRWFASTSRCGDGWVSAGWTCVTVARSRLGLSATADWALGAGFLTVATGAGCRTGSLGALCPPLPPDPIVPKESDRATSVAGVGPSCAGHHGAWRPGPMDFGVVQLGVGAASASRCPCESE